ncbi:MAG TPA: molecular chaperone GroEL [Flavisolibacter sp.]|jgi:chaperonin GroEL|nr:molecular chaperone GroEL [Flavisolibacter sp.]
MLKKTKYGSDARLKILEGVRKIAAAVKCTLGPSGRCVLISQSMVVDYGIHNLPIKITKDGYNTTRAFEINDEPFEQAGVLMVKEAAQKTVDMAGDGTTSTVILTEAIAEKGIELIEKGANPMELKRSIDKAVEVLTGQLKALSTPIKGNIDRIRQVATISANNDPEIGGWIADAFAKIGDDGIIDLEASKGVRTEIKISDGYKWDQSWTSPMFITNREKQIVEMEDPFILIYHNRINHHTQIIKALEMCQGVRPLLIICEDAVEEGLAFMVLNSLKGMVKVCAVKAPSFGEDRRIEMEDIAMLTGADYISDVRGINIKEIKKDNFGTAKKVIVTKDETIIIGGGGNKDSIESHINELRANLEEAKNEDEKFPIEKRIAKLKGGVAVIQVGAATETEMKEKLDRFDDAVRATKAAISEGYVAGGGTTYLRIRSGNEIVDHALDAILKQICDNAGVNADQITKQVKGAAGNIGYNAKTDKIEDLVESGVIDPTKVIRCAITNAASSAGMILTTESMIVDTM